MKKVVCLPTNLQNNLSLYKSSEEGILSPLDDAPVFSLKVKQSIATFNLFDEGKGEQKEEFQG